MSTRVSRMFAQLVLLGFALLPAAVCAQEPSGFLCCNLRYSGDWISDSNYGRGSFLAAGTPATVTGYGRNRVYVTIDGQSYRFGFDYGRRYETLQQFAAKLVVAADPRVRLATYPDAVREAIRAGKVSLGMTREQVTMAVGYPFPGYTASPSEPVWAYYLSRSENYEIHYGEDGRVREVQGRPEVLKFIVMEGAPPPPLAPAPAPKVREQIVLLPDADGKVGALLIRVGTQEQLLDRAYATAAVATGDPISVRVVTPAEAKGIAGEALQSLPPQPASFIILFELGSDRVRPGDDAIVDRIVAAMRERKVPDVSVVGHADRTGTSTVNEELSLRRAEAVYQRILSRGGQASAVEIVGKGDREIAVPQDRRVPEQRNRRVEIHVR